MGAAGDADARLRVLFDGNEVPRVTRSVFVLWNSGHETVRGSEVASTDVVRIELPAETTILATNIERTTRESINLRLAQELHGDRPSIRIAFDFLDRHDGVLFSVMHTAPTDGAVIRGTIQGMPEGITLWDSFLSDLDSYRAVRPAKRTTWSVFWALIKRLLSIAVGAFPPFILVCGLFSGLVLQFFPSLGVPDTTGMLVAGKFNWFYIGFGGLFTAIEYFLLRSWWRKPPKKLVNPKIDA